MRKNFDSIVINNKPKLAPKYPINCVLDATFFGNEYGYLSFHDTKQIIYTKEIKIESLTELDFCLDKLVKAGYTFKSFTLDGKPGFISRLEERFPDAQVQMCIFHQKMIVRRYITTNPKTNCGMDLKQLVSDILNDSPKEFTNKFIDFKNKYKSFISEKNDAGKFKHKKVRSAIRSLEKNKHLLFKYKLYPELNIPHTTNHIEGAFSHLKEKINIHRGMNNDRKKRAIIFLLLEGK